MPNTSIDTIHAFLGVRRIAIAGVSRRREDYSRSVFEELRTRGYDVIAVNPAIDQLDGVTFHPAVDQFRPAPEAAIILVPDRHVIETTQECIRAGVFYIWFRHSEMSDDIYFQAAEQARAAGITVISGECPLMFLPNGAWFHRAHATIRKWTGSYPA